MQQQGVVGCGERGGNEVICMCLHQYLSHQDTETSCLRSENLSGERFRAATSTPLCLRVHHRIGYEV